MNSRDIIAVLRQYYGRPELGWLIVGGIEETMRITLSQCQETGVAYFGKQMGSPWAKAHGDRGKGENMNLWPEDLRVREWPQAAMVLA